MKRTFKTAAVLLTAASALWLLFSAWQGGLSSLFFGAAAGSTEESGWEITIVRPDGSVRWHRIAVAVGEPALRENESGSINICWQPPGDKIRSSLLVEPGDTYTIKRYTGPPEAAKQKEKSQAASLPKP